MTIDITIGKKHTSTPMFPCAVAGLCQGATCQECLQLVQEEHHADAPTIDTATAQGPQHGGYNFARGIPGGYYARWLEETGILAYYPWLDAPDRPGTHGIPDDLPGYLHRLAVDIEIGKVVTKYPEGDAQFACWMAWWTGYAIRTYGLSAAISFS